MAIRQYGVTPPISTEPPTVRMAELSKSLHAELEARNQYEPPAEAKHREQVLGKLSQIVRQFVLKACQKNGVSAAVAAQAGGKIFTFGSYRLGVHGPGADIDTLCVVPKHVSREDFFTVFEEMLRVTPGVEELAGVPEAYVPIMKMKFEGVEIDLLFARLALHSIPDDLDLKDDGLLRNLDERCVRSLNGSRVTDEMLRLVPDVEVFREALRTIKLWAKRRAIYGNVMGFLGGVAWAMLVARICQLYPTNNAGGIVSRFFLIMYHWNWPQPVILKNIEDGPLPVRVWNPKLYPSDKAHRMPIITPAYPAMCSTHNVTISTQAITTEEFRRASHIVDRIAVGQAQWGELFAPHDFFIRYKHYLQITAASSELEKQLKWSGTVESKLRQLVMKLENVDTVTMAHPYVKAVMSGVISGEVAARKAEDVKDVAGAHAVYAAFYFVGMSIETTKIAGQNRKLDLSYPTNEFLRLAKAWDKFDSENMTIAMRTLKGAHLPDFVFENGERLPPKAVKRSKPGATSKVLHSLLLSDRHAASTDLESAAPRDLAPEGQPMKKHRASSFVPESAATAAASGAAINLPGPNGTASTPTTPSGDAARRLQALSTADTINGTPQPAENAVTVSS